MEGVETEKKPVLSGAYRGSWGAIIFFFGDGSATLENEFKKIYI